MIFTFPIGAISKLAFSDQTSVNHSHKSPQRGWGALHRECWGPSPTWRQHSTQLWAQHPPHPTARAGSSTQHRWCSSGNCSQFSAGQSGVLTSGIESQSLKLEKPSRIPRSTWEGEKVHFWIGLYGSVSSACPLCSGAAPAAHFLFATCRHSAPAMSSHGQHQA